MLRRVVPKGARINASRRQFGGMTDQPALDPRARIHFRVELKSENFRSESQSLAWSTMNRATHLRTVRGHQALSTKCRQTRIPMGVHGR
jgi:hypothetical protein